MLALVNLLLGGLIGHGFTATFHCHTPPILLLYLSLYLTFRKLFRISCTVLRLYISSHWKFSDTRYPCGGSYGGCPGAITHCQCKSSTVSVVPLSVKNMRTLGEMWSKKPGLSYRALNRRYESLAAASSPAWGLFAIIDSLPCRRTTHKLNNQRSNKTKNQSGAKKKSFERNDYS